MPDPNDQQLHSHNPNIIGIITDSDDFKTRLLNAKKELENSTKKLSNTVTEGLTAYTDEIKEGTKKKQLLIEQGNYLRSSEDKSDPLDKFIPSSDTPILNYLFFSARDGKYDKELKAIQPSADDLIKLRSTEKIFSETDYSLKDTTNSDVEELRQQFDDEFGKAFDSYEASQVNSPEFVQSTFKNATKEFESFLYKSENYDTFVKLKKLKALTKSENPAEAQLALTKCNELCKKYNLDLEKIPAFKHTI